MKHGLYDNENIFRKTAILEDPAKFPPYKPNIKAGSKPWICRPPRYTPEQHEAGEIMTKKHKRAGHWEVTLSAIYASPMMMVPKPGADPPWRPTVNQKNLNRIVNPVQWPFPDIRMAFNYIKRNKSKYFGTTDAKGGFFQIEIHEDFRHIFAIMTDKETLLPKRLVQGSVDSAKYFQGCLANALGDHIPRRFLQWLDDFVNHAASIDDLIDNWIIFFKMCTEKNVKLAISKTALGCKNVKFVGHILDGDGYVFEPASYNTLLKMPVPTDGAQLQQFVSCTNWMRQSLPRYVQVIQPLRDMLKSIYDKKGNCTKYGMKRFNLEYMGWNSSHLSAFNSIKNLIVDRIKIHLPDTASTKCVFTDASETGWSGVATQVRNFNVPDEDGVVPPIQDQHHSPLGFVSGIFRGSQCRWTIQSKEAYAIHQTMTKLTHITRCSQVQLFTDNRNVSYMYNPEKYWPEEDLPKQTRQRLRGWAETLDNFDYVIHHLSGIIMEQCCFADIVSRWANPEIEEVNKTPRSNCIRAKAVSLDSFHNTGYSTSLDAFDWPTSDRILAAQEKYRHAHKHDIKHSRRDAYLSPKTSKSNRIWIPDEAIELQVALCITSHCTASGHRDLNATRQDLKEVTWKDKVKDIKTFTKSCLQCNQTKGGHTIPRPWGTVITGKRPNDVITFDFLFIGSPKAGQTHKYSYVLALKDTFSHYVKLFATEAADAITAADCLRDWCHTFGTPSQFLSDQGSHFKNEVVNELARALAVLKHNFTTPHCPWANGSVERVNLEILNILTMLLSETGQPFWQWPYFLSSVQDILNSYRSTSLDGHCARKVFMNMERTDLVKVITHLPDAIELVDMEVDTDIITKQIAATHKALTEIHANVTSAKARRRAQNAKRRAKHSVKAGFDIGCFVHWSEINKRGKDNDLSKLVIQWRGPFRIVECLNDQLYRIQHLLDAKKTFEAHATRLKYYSMGTESIDDILIDNIRLQDSMRMHPERVIGTELDDESELIMANVQWRGFSELENSLEPFRNVLIDAPTVVHEYVNSLTDKREQNILQAIIDETAAADAATLKEKAERLERRKTRKRNTSMKKKRKREKHYTNSQAKKRRKTSDNRRSTRERKPKRDTAYKYGTSSDSD